MDQNIPSTVYPTLTFYSLKNTIVPY